ncbi:MAG: ribosome maturation factor RimM [Candidatus Contendobacter sp.]|jgi:16S rRNA processing protein RimM|nr:ribosome maturation factor RimM [Candidatus Contendobacter sp.]
MGDDWVVLGRVSGLFGLEGWVRIFSHTDPRVGIIRYQPVFLQQQGQWREVIIEAGRAHGEGVVLKFAGCDNRDQAIALMQTHIAVRRAQLPPLNPGEYYWTDLHGLRVITLNGVDLGAVASLFATGANDVMVVRGERERLLPFVRGQVVVEINLEQGLVRVDWDPDF